ncbi:MAG: Orotate phosphoribosyltransferase [Candidatus Latescibacteria bacterium ADurb.Bin168]|nr:MAG: Orotate phosphoribosyltransferase [Candidatus Latescibacteria bacterium ADurb.Bin168]
MELSALAKTIKEAAYLEGDFVLSSGKRSRYYLDKYLFSTEPRLLKAIAEALSALLPRDFDRLAGVELGAVPLVTAVALRTGKPFVIVRKNAKDYGTGKLFEGRLVKGDRVVLVEDVLTTASQAIQAARRLNEFGAEVVKIIYVIDREEGAADNLAAAGFSAEPVMKKSDLGL